MLCREERARLGSIGPHFYALSPAAQAFRIVRFAEALWESESIHYMSTFAAAMRLALRSMSASGEFPGVVRVRHTFVLIEGPGYAIQSAPEGTWIVEQPFA